MNVNALIIDDDKTNLDVLANLLKYEGVSSETIQDPRVIEQIVSNLPDLGIVFVDLELPYLNGYEILQILKDLQISAPIVACTVHTSESHHAQEQGFDGFIGKPLDADRFSEQLKRLLNGEPVWEHQ